MIERRVHYAFGGIRARCGIRFPKNWTIDPVKITCGNCKRLLGKGMK